MLVKKTVAFPINRFCLPNYLNKIYIYRFSIFFQECDQCICALELIQNSVPYFATFLLLLKFNVLFHIFLKNSLRLIVNLYVTYREPCMNRLEVNIKIVQNTTNITFLIIFLFIFTWLLLFFHESNYSYKWLFPKWVGYLLFYLPYYDNIILLFIFLVSFLLLLIILLFFLIFDIGVTMFRTLLASIIFIFLLFRLFLLLFCLFKLTCLFFLF